MPLIGTSQYYSGFSPISIPDCVLWLDAADSNVITLSGSNVTQWNDKSGRGFNFTKNASYPAPVYQTNGINGRPALQFSNDGNLGTTNTRFLENSSVSFDNTSYSIFAVANLTAVNSWTNAQYILKGEITGDNYLFFGSRAGNIATFTGPAGSWNDTNANSPTTTILNTPRIVAMTVSNAVMVPFYDGIAMSNKTGTTGSFSGLRLGETAPLGNSGQGWTGFISEVLVYSRAIPADQRQQVEGYLARKWGLSSNLPATQPFRTLPPFMRSFQPTDISGCGLWLDAMDPCGSGVRPATGSAIRTWVDKSGGGQNAASSGTAPTYSNNMVNFNGNGCVSNSAFTYALRNRSVFIVGSQTTASSASAFEGFFVLGATGGNFDYADVNSCVYLGRGSNSGQNDAFGVYLAGDYVVSYLTNAVPAPFAVYSDVFGSNSGTLFANGNSVQTDTTSGTIGSGTGYLVGARYYGGPAAFLNGGVSELIMYRTALTAGERQQVETYLTNKWGLRGSTPSNHQARLSPALSLAFVPTAVAPCALWLDAADRTAVTLSGSSVTSWLDKSGNARDASGGVTPAYVSSGINGLGVVSFNGSSTFLNTQDVYSNRSWVVFFVIRRQGVVADINPLLGGSAEVGNQNLHLIFNNNNTGIKLGFYGNDLNGTFTGYTGNTATEPAYLLTFLYTPGTRQIYVNGSLLVSDTNSTNLTSFANPRIGSYAPIAGAFYNGFMGEFITYNAVLTIAQRQSVEGYLANKWGLTNSLPAGHPFRRFKP